MILQFLLCVVLCSRDTIATIDNTTLVNSSFHVFKIDIFPSKTSRAFAKFKLPQIMSIDAVSIYAGEGSTSLCNRIEPLIYSSSFSQYGDGSVYALSSIEDGFCWKNFPYAPVPANDDTKATIASSFIYPPEYIIFACISDHMSQLNLSSISFKVVNGKCNEGEDSLFESSHSTIDHASLHYTHLGDGEIFDFNRTIAQLQTQWESDDSWIKLSDTGSGSESVRMCDLPDSAPSLTDRVVNPLYCHSQTTCAEMEMEAGSSPTCSCRNGTVALWKSTEKSDSMCIDVHDICNGLVSPFDLEITNLTGQNISNFAILYSTIYKEGDRLRLNHSNFLNLKRTSQDFPNEFYREAHSFCSHAAIKISRIISYSSNANVNWTSVNDFGTADAPFTIDKSIVLPAKGSPISIGGTSFKTWNWNLKYREYLIGPQSSCVCEYGTDCDDNLLQGSTIEETQQLLSVAAMYGGMHPRCPYLMNRGTVLVLHSPLSASAMEETLSVDDGETFAESIEWVIARALNVPVARIEIFGFRKHRVSVDFSRDLESTAYFSLPQRGSVTTQLLPSKDTVATGGVIFFLRVKETFSIARPEEAWGHIDNFAGGVTSALSDRSSAIATRLIEATSNKWPSLTTGHSLFPSSTQVSARRVFRNLFFGVTPLDSYSEIVWNIPFP